MEVVTRMFSDTIPLAGTQMFLFPTPFYIQLTPHSTFSYLGDVVSKALNDFPRGHIEPLR